MKRYFSLLVAVLAAATVSVSCKDDDDDDDYLSFEGSLMIDIPSYIAPGDVYTVTPTGLSRATEDTCTAGIGYYWTISPIATGKDTTRYENTDLSVKGSKTFTVQDTLCTYTIACVAFASGYTATTGYAYPTVVEGGDDKTLTGIVYDKNYDFSDSRDGKTYHATKIGDDVWMSQNLAYAAIGTPFAGCKAMEDVFGHYYDWNEAMTACPSGWHLPTGEEWQALAKAITGNTFRKDTTFTGTIAGHLMADGYFNGEVMWEYWPANKIVADSHFCSIPSGYAYKKTSRWYYAGSFYYAAYWTADEANGSEAYYRYIFAERPELQIARGDKKTFSAPVRCVKDRS